MSNMWWCEWLICLIYVCRNKTDPRNHAHHAECLPWGCFNSADWEEEVACNVSWRECKQKICTYFITNISNTNCGSRKCFLAQHCRWKTCQAVRKTMIHPYNPGSSPLAGKRPLCWSVHQTRPVRKFLTSTQGRSECKNFLNWMKYHLYIHIS